MEETMKKIYRVILTVGLFICGMHGLANATSLIINGVIDGPLAGGTPKLLPEISYTWHPKVQNSLISLAFYQIT
jgi:hypothetical protein